MEVDVLAVWGATSWMEVDVLAVWGATSWMEVDVLAFLQPFRWATKRSRRIFMEEQYTQW